MASDGLSMIQQALAEYDNMRGELTRLRALVNVWRESDDHHRQRAEDAEAEVERLREEAGNASLRAAFWESRAVGLGASSDDYQRHIEGEAP